MYESIGAAAVIGGAFIMGFRWLLGHVTKLTETNQKLFNDVLVAHGKLNSELREILMQNSAALERSADALNRVTAAIARCEK